MQHSVAAAGVTCEYFDCQDFVAGITVPRTVGQSALKCACKAMGPCISGKGVCRRPPSSTAWRQRG